MQLQSKTGPTRMGLRKRMTLLLLTRKKKENNNPRMRRKRVKSRKIQELGEARKRFKDKG